MALTVEDGTGKADADAFVSKEAMDAYATDRELNDWLNGAGDPEAAIRRATTYLSSAYNWKGYKLMGRAQALAWPRTEVVDEEGDDVASDSVPAEVVQACCELAAYEMANPGGLAPTVIPAAQVRRERVDVIEVEYAAAAAGTGASRPVLTLVEDMLSGLLAGTSGSLTGVAVRV